MYEIVAQGSKDQFTSLEMFEPQFINQESGELRLYVTGKIPQTQLDMLHEDLVASGVFLTEPIVQEGDIVFIRFQKLPPAGATEGIEGIGAIGPVAIIALVVGGVVAIWGSIAGWQLIKTVKETPRIVWIGLGGLLGFLLWRDLRKRKEA